MKVNDYIRTNDGIAKILEVRIDENNSSMNRIVTDELGINFYNDILKSSPNIVELLKPMDLMYIDIDNGYAGGIIVPRIAETQNELNEYIKKFKDGTYILKGVVTHEQLENNVYKVGEQDEKQTRNN